VLDATPAMDAVGSILLKGGRDEAIEEAQRPRGS
jgi:hypothetical protein